MRLLHLILFITFFMAVCSANAQNLIIHTARQERCVNENAKLICEPLRLKKTAYIVSVENAVCGFWIEKRTKSGNRIENVFLTEESAKKDAVGLILKPGTYFFYPNLKDDIDSVKIRIKLKQ